MTKEKVLWGYDEKTGPEMWGHICSDFEIAHTGKAQSPVDIEQADVVKLKPSTMKFYYKETDYTIRRIEQSVHVFRMTKNKGYALTASIIRLYRSMHIFRRSICLTVMYIRLNGILFMKNQTAQRL